MLSILLAYKPFTNRKEYVSLSEHDLEMAFYQFLKSDMCPFFVREKYSKANKPKQRRNKNIENANITRQDEIEDSSESESDDEFDNLLNNIPGNNIPHREHTNIPPTNDLNQEKHASDQEPQLGRFTEAYQEFGHMAPKGLEYEGIDIAYIDDDKDVLEEINVLSDKQDMIFDPTKDTCNPIYLNLIDLANNAKKTLKDRIGLKTTTEVLDPNDLDPTQTILLHTILEWTRQCINCKKKK